MPGYHLTAIIERESQLFVARCVELDIVHRGASRADALANLKDAVATFLSTAPDDEIVRRLEREIEVELFEVDPALQDR